MLGTNWVKVNVPILGAEIHQVFQSHVRGFLHRLQIFLTVGSKAVANAAQ